ncbi:peptidase inhibitor family I36 protein [Streptomyces sp. RFCAC02]|uniref:peptidase inhibitor family I36 protein n=1 Tax=Streptomyces sp. RFCAC02 TaxID=2499143 RepID=UPI00143D7F06|nr:peptidase inhibitor family I36 protein [Streptomyces sp. RFCAC02]
MSLSTTVRARAAGLTGAAVIAAALLGVAAPQAYAAKSDCPAGALCAYQQTNFGGTPGRVYENNTDLTSSPSFSAPKSVYNHGNSCDVTIYTGRNYSGYSMTIDRGDAYTLSTDSVFRTYGIASNRWVNCV